MELEARPDGSKDPSRQEIRAEVTGPLSQLSYKWLTETGECNPQESDTPFTVYKFAPATHHDRVTVEVWMGGQRVALGQIDVTVAEVKRKKPEGAFGRYAIEITTIPPYDPVGGYKTRSDIAGRVAGDSTEDLKVAVYSRSKELWYLQPGATSVRPIGQDHTWSSWTHTGSSYAALLIQRDYKPVFTLDVLPLVGGDILARKIVEGRTDLPVPNADAVEDDDVHVADDQPVTEKKPASAPKRAAADQVTFPTVRIKAGSPTEVRDSGGNLWLADQGFTDGAIKQRDGASGVANTDSPALYRSEHFKMSRFAWPVPNGRYLVKLYFAETYPKISHAGERLFSYDVEGREFTDFDIFQRAGGLNRAYVEAVPVYVGDGELTITFKPKIQFPLVNGIEIISLPEGAL